MIKKIRFENTDFSPSYGSVPRFEELTNAGYVMMPMEEVYPYYEPTIALRRMPYQADDNTPIAMTWPSIRSRLAANDYRDFLLVEDDFGKLFLVGDSGIAPIRKIEQTVTSEREKELSKVLGQVILCLSRVAEDKHGISELMALAAQLHIEGIEGE